MMSIFKGKYLVFSQEIENGQNIFTKEKNRSVTQKEKRGENRYSSSVKAPVSTLWLIT